MRSHARVVVIGGGAVGCSALYHLTRLGWTDVVLLERDELTSGSTWHAAGNCPNFSTSWNLIKLQRYSTRLYADLARLTGYAINHHVTGSIRLAHTRERLDEFQHVMSQARALGIEFELLSPPQIRELHPFLETDGILAGLHDPYDGDIDPAQLTQAFAKGARDSGAEICRATRVTAISRLPSGEWRIDTNRGSILAGFVINAAGYRGGEIAAMVGAYLPIVTLSHQYLVTDDIPELLARGAARLPLVRDPDVSYYLRQERQGLILGPYERQARARWLDGIPEDFASQLFDDDLERLEPYIEAACARIPILGSVGIRSVINGPIPYAPDGNPLMGPAPGLPGFFHCCAFTFGIVQAGGAGKSIAEWVVQGQPQWDLWPLDSRRYPLCVDARFALAKGVETYQNEYAVAFPVEERPAGRPMKTSPVHPVLEAKGACFGVRGGWERAVYFPKAGEYRIDALESANTFRRPPWHAAVARECHAVAERVGLLDLPGFTKFDVTGAGARAWLDTLVTGVVPRPGRTALNYMCGFDGGIVTEMTLTCLSEGHFWLMGAAAGERHDAQWLQEHLATMGSPDTVRIENLTERYGTLVLAGPRSRELLSTVTSTPLTNAEFPWLSVRRIRLGRAAFGRAAVGRADVIAMRVNYVGELGWELHVPIEQMSAAYDRLWDAGTAFGIADFGLYALDSLRLEKCYRSWKADITREYTPWEASLDRFVRLDKPGGFMGRDALHRAAQSGVSQRFVPLLLDSPDADAAPVSIVFHGEERVGLVTSGGFGHRLQRSVALAYLRSDLITPETELQVEILGSRCRATVGREPLYDPANARLQA